MNKVYPNPEAALAGLIEDSMTLALGGFGICGIPENMILALRAMGRKNLTIISNDPGICEWEMVCSFRTILSAG